MNRLGQILSMIFLFAIAIALPLTVALAISGMYPDAKIYLLSDVARKASPIHWWLQTTIWAALVLLSITFGLHAKTMTTDLERRVVDGERKETEAAQYRPPAISSEPDKPLDKAIAYYEALGYTRLRSFDGFDGENLLLYALEAKSDVAGIWRRDAAVIYPSGDSAKLSVGILYETDSWAYNSEYRVQRNQFGRAVKIKTALDRPILEYLAERSQHILTIGLASYSAELADDQTADDNQLWNEQLAVARAYNLGYAAWELKWQPDRRIYPLTLGQAVSPPIDPVLEPLQRTAVLIGVNASIDVLARDMVIAAMSMIELRGVNLSNYSRRVDRPGEVRRIRPGSGYLPAKEVEFSDGSGPSPPPLVLKPVKEDQ